MEEYAEMVSHKICNRCHVLKPVTAFDLNQNQKGDRPIRRPGCKACRLDIDRRYVPARIKRLAEKEEAAGKISMALSYM